MLLPDPSLALYLVADVAGPCLNTSARGFLKEKHWKGPPGLCTAQAPVGTSCLQVAVMDPCSLERRWGQGAAPGSVETARRERGSVAVRSPGEDPS